MPLLLLGWEHKERLRLLLGLASRRQPLVAGACQSQSAACCWGLPVAGSRLLLGLASRRQPLVAGACQSQAAACCWGLPVAGSRLLLGLASRRQPLVAGACQSQAAACCWGLPVAGSRLPVAGSRLFPARACPHKIYRIQSVHCWFYAKDEYDIDVEYDSSKKLVRDTRKCVEINWKEIKEPWKNKIFEYTRTFNLSKKIAMRAYIFLHK